ncbi:hypothetical protein AUK22_04980 [bacterium CG2_30_54_10]|nr:MAG: hypothetical protein AUK22_04980 [bacterium CG2_30_54_10]
MLKLEERRWPTVVVAILLIWLIYNFLNTIFKSNIKRFSQDRIYVDYSTYSKPQKGVSEQSSYSPAFSNRFEEARRTLNEGRTEAAMGAYTSFMADRMSRMPQDPYPIRAKRIPEFEEMRALAAVDIPEISAINGLYGNGKYDQAAGSINEILSNLPENDVHHRSQLLDTLSECYFKLKNRDGYVTNKVKYLQCMRRLKSVVEKAYPRMNADQLGVWISAEEGTRQLLRIKTLVGDSGGNPEKEALLLRAELDAEVARAVNQ